MAPPPPERPVTAAVDPTSLDALATEIRRGLGVPFVNLIFHRLAAWPDYLTQVWTRSVPLLGTADFAQAAERLSRLAVIADTARITLPPDVPGDDLRRARELTEAYVYVQPKLLLLAAGWAAGLAAGHPAPTPPAPPAGPPIRTLDEDVDVPMIDLPPTDPAVAALFERMVRGRGHPGVASYYRSLANWPGLLTACWEAIEPLTESCTYHERARELATTATDLATTLGLREAGAVGTTHGAELGSLLGRWRDVQIPHLMIDTRHVHHGLALGRRDQRRS